MNRGWMEEYIVDGDTWWMRRSSSEEVMLLSCPPSAWQANLVHSIFFCCLDVLYRGPIINDKAI